MTDTELINDVASAIGMSVSTATRVTATEARQWLNQAYRMACSKLADAGVNYFNSESTSGDTTDGTGSYSLASDFLKMKALKIQYEDDTDKIDVTPIDMNQIQDDLSPESEPWSKLSPYYWIWDGSVYIRPTPDETSSVVAGTWTVDAGAAYTYWYYQRPDDLDGTTYTTPVIPADYHHVLGDYASFKALRKLGKTQESSNYERRYKEGMLQMIGENVQKDESQQFSFRVMRGKNAQSAIYRP